MTRVPLDHEAGSDDLTNDERALLRAAVAAAAVPRPSSSTTTRRARAVSAALARDGERQRRAVPRRLAAAVAVCFAGTASAATAWVLSSPPSAPSAPSAPFEASTPLIAAPSSRLSGAVVVAPPALSPIALSASAPASSPAGSAPPAAIAPSARPAPAPSSSAPTPRVAPRIAPSDRAGPAARSLGHGDTDAGASPSPAAPSPAAPSPAAPSPAAPSPAAPSPATPALPVEAMAAARALGHGDTDAATALTELARRDADAALAALAVVDDDDGDAAFPGPGAVLVARLRCTLGLRYRRDARAVSACAAFGQRFPDDPAARALAFGAGGLAEELGLLSAAVDAYSRVIVLSPLVGATWHDALFARARARAALGDLDEASGDLRIYLRQNPSAAASDDVVALMRTLRWPR